MKKIIMMCMILILMAGIPARVQAEEITDGQGSMAEQSEDYLDEINCEEIQQVMEEILKETTFDFREAMENAISGQRIISGENLVNAVMQAVRQAFAVEKSMITRILVITVVGAIFVNFSNVFKSSQVADTSFFITYLLLFSAMSVSFYSISQTASAALENLLEFMRALLPSYFIAVTFATSPSASFMFYEIAMVLVVVVEAVMVKVVIPMIHIYFVISLVNYISKEDYLSKAAELLDTVIKWTLRSLLGVTVGYNFIQGMIVPAADYLKNSLVLKTAKMIPGVGNALGSVAESVLGAGVLVKNAVGTVGIVAIVLIMSVPMIKIGFYCILYKLGAAVIQPISDKRILECMEGASKGASLLLYLVFSGSVMFLLMIAIVMASTNQYV